MAPRPSGPAPGRPGRAARAAVLGVTGEGEPEGELGLFLESPRMATTTARTPVSVLMLAPEDWDRLCTESPGLADEIRVGVCRHLARRFGLPAFAGVPVEEI